MLGAALDNALRTGDAALTGPVVRGDAGTVAAHLAELATVSTEAYDAYVAMARLTADRALAAGMLTAERAEALLEVLAGKAPRPPRSGTIGRTRGRSPSMTIPYAPTEATTAPTVPAAPPTVVTDRASLRAHRDALPGPVAVVMTMGALHEGHAALIREARHRAASVIVTIFLNPLQFGAGEDLSAYPRTIDADLALCAREGVDLVFHPAPEVVYPDGEGATLPGPARCRRAWLVPSRAPLAIPSPSTPRVGGRGGRRP